MPKITKTNKKSVVFYVLHLPILLALLLITALSTYAVSKGVAPQVESNSVLGDDDDEDDEDNSGSGSDNDSDEEDDSDEDNDNSGRADDLDDDDSDEDKDEDENEGPDDLDDEDENELEDDEDLDDAEDEDSDIEEDDEDESKTAILNDDGTYSIVEVENENGELKYEIKTFSADGIRIGEEKFESKDGEEKSRITIYDATGKKIGDFRLETEDGKKLELRMKSNGTELSRVKFDVENQELLVRSDDSPFSSDNEPDENRLKIRAEGNNFILTRRGINALSNFPLTVDDATGTVYVQTPVGEVKLGAMPDSIVEKAEASDDIDDIESVELASGSDDNEGSLEFVLTGTKAESLLGIFKLQIPSILIYNAETGEFTRTDQPFLTRILDLFSF